MWTEVSSSVPHFLHKGLIINPIRWRCLLRVLCPVRTPITTLDCVLLKDNNLVFVIGLGPEISFRFCKKFMHRNHRCHYCHHSWRVWSSLQQVALSNVFHTPPGEFAFGSGSDRTGFSSAYTSDRTASSFGNIASRPAVQTFKNFGSNQVRYIQNNVQLGTKRSALLRENSR
jgi:hypothetical protein